MKLVADENIPGLDRLFASLNIEISRVAGRSLSRDDLIDADAVMIRSVSKINYELLVDTPVKFVGTCTIGTDHIDKQALDKLGITWASAPGCNAESVADYVMAALAQLNIEPNQKKAVVVGGGNVGSKVIHRLQTLGTDVTVVDPWLETAAAPLGELSDIAQADIISLHTPLVKDGPYPTVHLIDVDVAQQFKPGAVVISAGRGAVVSDLALRSRPDVQWVMDVWEYEPAVAQSSIAHAAIATPHIAGYSNEGKLRGAWMIYQAMAEKFGWPVMSFDHLLGTPIVATVKSDNWSEQILMAYPIIRDHQDFVAAMGANTEHNRMTFDQLRKHYPGRHELSRYQRS